MEKPAICLDAAVKPQDDPSNIKRLSAYLVILCKLREVASRRRAVRATAQIRQNGFQNESPTRRRQRIARVALGFPERGIHGMYAFAGISMATR